MGMYAVDFQFECSDDNGIDLSQFKSIQEMDAFIGYGASGKTPPSVVVVKADRSCVDKSTGEAYDPASWGHECDEAFPSIYDRKRPKGMDCIRIVIEGGKARTLCAMTEEEVEQYG